MIQGCVRQHSALDFVRGWTALDAPAPSVHTSGDVIATLDDAKHFRFAEKTLRLTNNVPCHSCLSSLLFPHVLVRFVKSGDRRLFSTRRQCSGSCHRRPHAPRRSKTLGTTTTTTTRRQPSSHALSKSTGETPRSLTQSQPCSFTHGSLQLQLPVNNAVNDDGRGDGSASHGGRH